MFDMCRNSLRLIVMTIAIAGLGTAAHAQTVRGLNEAPGAQRSSDVTGDAPPLFLGEPEAQIKGDKIKRETFRSQPAGQNQNWNLDIGRFQPPIHDDPNQVADDLTENYSGMRLRLPFRGGTK